MGPVFGLSQDGAFVPSPNNHVISTPHIPPQNSSPDLKEKKESTCLAGAALRQGLEPFLTLPKLNSVPHFLLE